MVDKTFCCHWSNLAAHFKNHFGINTNFVLCVAVESELEEVEKIMKIHFPVEFCIQRKRQIYAGDFAGKTTINLGDCPAGLYLLKQEDGTVTKVVRR